LLEYARFRCCVTYRFANGIADMNSPSRAAFNKSTEGVNLEGELEFALVISGHSLVSFQFVLHFSNPDVIYYTRFNLLFLVMLHTFHASTS